MVDPLLFLMLSDKLQRMDNTVSALRKGSALLLPQPAVANEIEVDADNLRRQLDNYKAGKM